MSIFLGILPDMGQYAVYIWSTYGVALVGHGRSTAPLVAGAIRHVKRAVDANLLETLKSELTKIQGLEE